MSPPADQPEILVFTVDAGGGHRAATRALLAAAAQRRAPFRLRVENLQEVLAPLDPVRRLTGVSLEGAYNLILRGHWTVLLLPLLRLMHGAIAVRRRALTRAVREHLQEHPPAAVLSILPNFNAVVRDAWREVRPGAPFVVLLTDFADFPPRFWIEPGIGRVIVGSEQAVEQARGIGIPADRVSRVSGMVLNPSFYGRGGPEARERVRRELGLGSDFTVVLLYGGKGSPEMEPLSARLLEADPAMRVIAIAGDNPKLLARLEALRPGSGARLQCVGFTDRVAEYMAAADLLVTKPGPGSLAEAFHQGAAVVVVRDRSTIPQERYNTRFVEEHGLGVVVGRWADIPATVLCLARDRERLARLRANVRALPENRAVYEVLEILAREIGGGPSVDGKMRNSAHGSEAPLSTAG
jgi:1,2-diacylglycerol 3-beta-galactosyltransferase